MSNLCPICLSTYSYLTFFCIRLPSASLFFFFFFKQKTAYEMRISDWSSDVCSSDLSEHSNRAIRLEQLVSRVLVQRPAVVRIALTAVAGGAAGPVAKWIEGRADATAVGVRYRSTRQVIGVLETAPGAQGRILLDIMNGRTLYVRGQEQPVYLPLRMPAMPNIPARMRSSLNRFNS